MSFKIDADSSRIIAKYVKTKKQPFSKYVPNATADALNLIEALLTINPTQRPTAVQALSYPFLPDAKVLHDYSRSYLTKPTVAFFEFEQKQFSVPELRGMIVEEVRLLAADAYRICIG